jgi:hypothetical protein
MSSAGGRVGTGFGDNVYELRTLRGVAESTPYERCRTSAAIPPELSLTTGRRGGKDSGPIFGRRRRSTVPITGASSIPSA